MDFILVVCGCIDVAASVRLEVGWVWTYILESNGVGIPQLVNVSRLLFLLVCLCVCVCVRASIRQAQLKFSVAYSVRQFVFDNRGVLGVRSAYTLIFSII